MKYYKKKMLVWDPPKGSTISMQQVCYNHPPFNKVHGRKPLPLKSDLDLQLMGKERQCPVNFIHLHCPYYHSHHGTEAQSASYSPPMS